ncbi:hypothetical protein [Rhodococcus rhodochrous]|uniref:hypothetical protein n=1 Tax=Rhodococcus rhodochrous TaxID=1829 RepID=UPI0002D5D18C|nr:hypothetical protein [Rhodococcus rhodochrous]
MKAHKSALKHGIDEADSLYAAQHHVYAADLEDDNPAQKLRLGFDAKGRLLELVILRFDSGNELLIHSMKARSRYFDLLP